MNPFVRNSEPERLSRADWQAAGMIGVLMSCAKTLEQSKKIVANPDDEQAAGQAAKSYELLMKTMHRLFPNGDMEQQVIEFAKSIGFQVEQRMIQPGSKVQQ